MRLNLKRRQFLKMMITGTTVVVLGDFAKKTLAQELAQKQPIIATKPSFRTTKLKYKAVRFNLQFNNKPVSNNNSNNNSVRLVIKVPIKRPNNQVPGIKLTIETEYTNKTGNPVYLIGCGKPSAPILQKYVDGQWVTAYAPVEAACLSIPPLKLQNGEIYRETYYVEGYLPGYNFAPTFDVPVPGRYRLVREIYKKWSDKEQYASELLP